MQDNNSKFIQIQGVIKSLEYGDHKEINWWNYRRPVIYGPQNFDATCFSAQIDQYSCVGHFTQLVFTEEDEVEVVLKRLENSQYYQVYALQHQQILHLMPELHSSYLYVDPNQKVPNWMWIISLLSILLLLKSFGIVGALIASFSVLVVIAFSWVLFRQLRGRWKNFLIKHQLFKMPLMQQISLSQASQSQHWYRMQEFVIDLNLVKR
ncbi:hypothetical protein [Acinetobacter sp. Marseille-Q1618]|uniref:hypothetical protein n=1 Tax=Acinetobacter sp. Marseille-Q1618 TaxID=2697502 RepID=UPI00156E8ADB|nr:hypothetical protein [Acinetobacter sp. Marseille-Q1618]